jgi:hypothetical protein
MFVLLGDEAAITKIGTLSIGNSVLSCRPLESTDWHAPVRCKVAVYDTTGGISDPRCVESAMYRIALSPVTFGSEGAWPIDEVIFRAQPPEHVAKTARVTAGTEFAVLGSDVFKVEPRRKGARDASSPSSKFPLCIALSAATAHKEIEHFWSLLAARVEAGDCNEPILVPYGAIPKGAPNIMFYEFDEFPRAALSSRLTVTRTGLTAYELAYLNVPAAYWVSDINDAWFVEDLVALGFGNAVYGSAENVIDAVLDTRAMERIQMRDDTANRTVDGCGASRIAALVEERVASII